MQSHHAVALHVLKITGNDSRYLRLLRYLGATLAVGAGAATVAIIFPGLIQDLMTPIASIALLRVGVLGMIALIATGWKLVRTAWAAVVLLVLRTPWNTTMTSESSLIDSLREELFDIWAT